MAPTCIKRLLQKYLGQGVIGAAPNTCGNPFFDPLFVWMLASLSLPRCTLMAEHSRESRAFAGVLQPWIQCHSRGNPPHNAQKKEKISKWENPVLCYFFSPIFSYSWPIFNHCLNVGFCHSVDGQGFCKDNFSKKLAERVRGS